MNRQELFEKALNEFYVWPYDKVGMVYCIKGNNEYKAVLFSDCDDRLDKEGWTFVCTREEFEAAKAKQKKPKVNWNEAPENATHALTTGKSWTGDSYCSGSVVFATLKKGFYHDVDRERLRYCVGNSDWVVLEARPEKPIYTKEMHEAGGRPKSGMKVTIPEHEGIWSDCAHLVGCPVTVMATFTGLGKDLDGTSIQMVAVSSDNGSSACFRADMCKPIDTRTAKEKAIDEIFNENIWDNNIELLSLAYDKWVGDENEK